MLRGIIPAFVSPLYEDGSVNGAVTQALLEYELAQGADGLYICGGTGEGLVMRPSARMELAEICAAHIGGRVPLIAHIADMELATALELARHAEKTGCDCVAAIPPTYFPYGADDIYNYYKAISDAVHIPVMIYYHPAAGVALSAELVKRLFEIENIRAVKWSSSDYYQMLRLKDLTHGEMNILNGPDETLLCGLSCGADGGIGSTYNLMLPEYRALYARFLDGDVRGAREMQHKVNRAINALLRCGVISSVKAVLTRRGFDVGYATYPMHRLTADELAALIADLSAQGLEL